jgi:hypothetical protein
VIPGGILKCRDLACTCTHPKTYHFSCSSAEATFFLLPLCIYKCMHTAGRSTMHGMSWSGFVTGAVDACMMSLLLRVWWAARPEAALVGTPLGQDGRPSTCAISGPRRSPGTFDTPNCTVSSVRVGWWRSGAANWKTPVDFFLQRYETRSLYGASSRGIHVKKYSSATRVLEYCILKLQYQ